MPVEDQSKDIHIDERLEGIDTIHIVVAYYVEKTSAATMQVQAFVDLLDNATPNKMYKTKDHTFVVYVVAILRKTSNTSLDVEDLDEA